MEEKKVSTLFEEMRDDISKYISSSLELGKLEVYEKLSLGSSAITYGLILGGLSLFVLLFLFVTVALYLGDLLQNLWAGFGIVTAFALLVLLIMLLVGKPFKKKMTNKVVHFLMENDESDNKKSKP
ncbi:MAG TPA: phage holin family protein [Proteiniphilum sp.]|nr:phage holin family protein [Proteiniphilum sp.]HPD85875.1 phage holin family protein [Proteiniphilum sp.]HPJ50009.1 phage holin family protein [Proteiniphilum sp.]HPR19647.1 phage holin family protein [Proteiniphilum sp.]